MDGDAPLLDVREAPLSGACVVLVARVTDDVLHPASRIDAGNRYVDVLLRCHLALADRNLRRVLVPRGQEARLRASSDTTRNLWQEIPGGDYYRRSLRPART